MRNFLFYAAPHAGLGEGTALESAGEMHKQAEACTPRTGSQCQRLLHRHASQSFPRPPPPACILPEAHL